MQTDKITYTTKYNKRFFTEIIFFQYYRQFSIILLTLGGIVSFILAIGYLLSWNPFRFHSFPYFTAFYAVFVFILPVLLKWRIEKSLTNHALMEKTIRFEITEAEIQIFYDQNEKVIRWGQLYQIKNHPKAWILYGTPQSFFYILKNELAPEQQKVLESWMKASLKLT